MKQFDSLLRKIKFPVTFCFVIFFIFCRAGMVIALNKIAGTSKNIKVVEQSDTNKSRLKHTINDSWKFKYFDSQIADAQLPDFDTSDWDRINIPHTWNINDAKDDTSNYRRGIGWYRKNIRLNNSIGGQKIFLHFEGANQITELFINGSSVGVHIGGYTAFTFDVTEFIHFDGRENINTIAVKVDNRFDKNVPPLSADFTFYGGIYRDIWLITTDPLHFTLTNYGSGGIFITTPEVSNDRANVKIKGTFVNESESNKSVTVRNNIIDAAGNIFKKIEKKFSVKKGEKRTFEMVFNRIEDFETWSPEKPYLYTIYTELLEAGKIVDRIRNPLGFHWYSFNPDKGFFLNGKNVKLVGTNRHQDYQGMGNAVSDGIHVKDLKLIKDAGFNFLRLAHYPQDPVVLETADRLGLIIWEEIPIVNYVTTSDLFKKNSRQMLKEMIRQHYNHPSVFLWGYMNEVFLNDRHGTREKNYTEEYLNWTIELAKSLESVCFEEDPDRNTAMAINQSQLYNQTGIAEIPDVLGYNLYMGWYGGRFESLGNFLDSEHEKYPGRLIMVSEYGAGSDERLHSLDPVRFDFSVEHQQNYHESYMEQFAKRPYLNGTAVWNHFDFGSDSRHDSKPKINQNSMP